MTYDLPDEIQVEADGPIRIVRLNRPEQLNATNHELHAGLAALFPQLDADLDARVAVHHRQRPGVLRRRRLRLPRRAHRATPTCGARRWSTAGRSSPAWWRAGCRSSPRSTGRPSASAAASWPCPTSSTWPRAPTSPTPTCWSASSPPTAARSRGRCSPASSWPRSTPSPATASRRQRAAEIGLVNHVCPDDEVLDQALACARRIAAAAAAGRRGHQAHPQPAPRAGRAGHPRLRPQPPRTARSPRRSCGPTSTGCWRET